MRPHLVSAPGSVEPRAEWGQVHLRVEPGDDVARVVERFAERTRLRRIDLPADRLSHRLLAVVGDGVRVVARVGPESPDPIDGGLLRREHPSAFRLWVEPVASEPQAALRTTETATARGLPVVFGPSPEALTGRLPLLALLDHYLFHPELAVPIEPFHSMLLALGAGGHRTLWQIWFGAPRDYFHIEHEDAVSLCGAWAAHSERRYGVAGADPDAWRQSAAYRDLCGTLDAFPKDPESCASCSGRSLCGGALRALHERADCELWCEIVERLTIVLAKQREGHSR